MDRRHHHHGGGGVHGDQRQLRHAAGPAFDLPGSYWYLEAPATTVEYVDVQDSYANPGSSPPEIITAELSTDSGHNVNWNIPGGGVLILR
jgi:hypothetical protein